MDVNISEVSYWILTFTEYTITDTAVCHSYHKLKLRLVLTTCFVSMNHKVQNTFATSKCTVSNQAVITDISNCPFVRKSLLIVNSIRLVVGQLVEPSTWAIWTSASLTAWPPSLAHSPAILDSPLCNNDHLAPQVGVKKVRISISTSYFKTKVILFLGNVIFFTPSPINVLETGDLPVYSNSAYSFQFKEFSICCYLLQRK